MISGLQKSDIAEMKTLNNPPEAIVVIMGAICHLFGNKEKEQDWKHAKKLLQTDLLARLHQFDPLTVNKKMFEDLKTRYTKNEEKKDHFNKDLVQRKSKAAAGLS